MEGTVTDQRWLRMTVTLPDGAPDEGLVEETLTAAAGAVQVEDAHTLPDGSRPLKPGMRRYVAWFDIERDDQVETLRQTLRAQLESSTESEVLVDVYDDNSWRDGWKAWFQPMQVSPRLAIRAPWAELDVDPGVETLVIEPGMAFGTGTHETTRLCLALIDELVGSEPPAAMLDVGCGSGVLAIAAARLGVPRVVGVDVDRAAVEASVENADVNGVSGDFSTRSVDDLHQRFPLVVANIISSILTSLRQGIVARVADGGVLVLSGLLTDEARPMAEAYVDDQDSWWIERVETMGEWAAVVIRAGRAGE